jgi:hypothetical protein
MFIATGKTSQFLLVAANESIVCSTMGKNVEFC